MKHQLLEVIRGFCDYYWTFLFESLKDYFENTPKDVLDNDWKEIKYLNEIGPDVIEYAKFVREKFGIAVSYSNSEKKTFVANQTI